MMQKRIKYPLLSLLLFLLASCSVEIPKDIIQPSQLEALLYDYHLVQAMSTDASDEYKRRLYAAFVFDKHTVSKEYFDSSMMWYARNPKYLHKIYNTLYDKIDAEIALMSGEKRIANVEVNPLSGDTVDLWSDAKVMLLTSSPYFRRKTFAYEADTTFVDGDSIAFSAVLHFISPEGKPKAQAHIALLAGTYLLFSIFFSLNDIAYWSLMPAISKDQKVREGVGAFARICANIGMFAMVLIYLSVPDMFAGLGLNARNAYFVFAIIIAILMMLFQSITLFGVKEDRSHLEKAEHTSIKDLFRALAGNDQLLVTAISMALFMVGYCTTTGFGTYYFKYAYKNEDVYMVFAAVLAVAQLAALSVFPLFRKKFTRKQLYTGSTIAVIISYIIFFLSFEFLPLIVIAGLGLFFAQAFIQLLMLLFLADAVEYGEWKLGKRNEAASFAVQPFINQFGGAASKGVISLTLIVSGINMIAQSIDKNPEKAEELIMSTPSSALWIMKLAMMIFPLICILIGFVLYHKKFKIDEEMYATILADLEERNKANGENNPESKEISEVDVNEV